jgi:hypothetical protein
MMVTVTATASAMMTMRVKMTQAVMRVIQQ